MEFAMTRLQAGSAIMFSRKNGKATFWCLYQRKIRSYELPYVILIPWNIMSRPLFMEGVCRSCHLNFPSSPLATDFFFEVGKENMTGAEDLVVTADWESDANEIKSFVEDLIVRSDKR
jgi:hypothetical protein